jgi:hypothetical protein
MPTFLPEDTDISPFKNIFLNYITDKCTHHSYADIYDYYLQEHREEFQSVLELGIFKGGSLYGWRDYFPNANIFGLDNNPDYIFQDNRITCILGDSSFPRDLTILGKQHGPFDLIVDDAGHQPEAQLIALLNLWEYLKPGGIYAIEDLRVDLYYNLHNAFALLPGVIYDGREISGVPNDVIMVLQKEG